VKTRSKRNQSLRVSDEFLDFTASVHFDQRLWRYDIAGSIAHAHALAGAGILNQKEKSRIVAALRQISRDLEKGSIELDPALEDIHMNIEKILTDRVGALGAKIHTARSRNDQVALDLRLMVREALADTVRATLGLQQVLLDKAKEHQTTVVPGYTHMQHAQPIVLSHHLLAHFWRLDRDVSRMVECYARANVSPLGAGALAGSTFDIDREIPAKVLMTDGITMNSLDAVSDRDFAAESAFALSMIMIHLSSLCEELVLWSSQEFQFVRLPKRLSSGSSMMPQKLNPDIPELVRGKSGRTTGGLIAILTMLKSLPLAYNRDLQEDKENLFDVFDTVGASLHALTDFLRETMFDVVRMRESAGIGLMTATDLADFLVTRGIPFRTSHGIVAEIAASSGGDDEEFRKIAVRILRKHVNGLKESDLDFLCPEKCVKRRESAGATGPKAVRKQIKIAKASISSTKDRLADMDSHAAAIDKLLYAR